MRRLLDAIIANNNVLEECSRHSFDIDISKRVADKRWKCSNCGGELDDSRKSWYEKGLEHGKRN